MKVIQYKFSSLVNRGTDDAPRMVEELVDKAIGYSSENVEIAKKESYRGEYTIEEADVL